MRQKIADLLREPIAPLLARTHRIDVVLQDNLRSRQAAASLGISPQTLRCAAPVSQGDPRCGGRNLWGCPPNYPCPSGPGLTWQPRGQSETGDPEPNRGGGKREYAQRGPDRALPLFHRNWAEGPSGRAEGNA